MSNPEELLAVGVCVYACMVVTTQTAGATVIKQRKLRVEIVEIQFCDRENIREFHSRQVSQSEKFIVGTSNGCGQSFLLSKLETYIDKFNRSYL